MKHWRFLPILVKEEVLKNMDLSDELSFSKCSKKCLNLLSRIPNHLECFRIPNDNQLSVDDFLVLMTCRKSTIQNLIVEIELSDESYQVIQFLLKLNEVRKSLKVKKLMMEISPEYSGMFKKCIDFCDPAFIESIEIEGLDSQEVYEDILRTPQWKNSREVLLNGYFNGLLEVNLNDFLHFKSIELKMEELGVDDAWKLVQMIILAGNLPPKNICHLILSNPLDLCLVKLTQKNTFYLTIRLPFLKITMKHWRFFPILVKEEVLENMDLSDRLSFSKCSKRCRNLLSRIPNHLEIFTIPNDDQLSLDDFLTLITYRKSTVHKLKVAIETADERDQVNQFLLKLNEIRNTLKVKIIVMEINPEYSEMYKKFIDLCDPSFIYLINIKKLDSQEIYEHILRTPQWKNSRMVTLNWDTGSILNMNFDGLLKVNLNDFLHFKFIYLKMEELSVDDAWKLVQNIVSTGSQDDHIDIRIQAKNIRGDLIGQKIETELVGDWKDRPINGRYLRHPENPNKVLEYYWGWGMFYIGVPNIEDFNMRLEFFAQFQ